jgi:hypothetical protein
MTSKNRLALVATSAAVLMAMASPASAGEIHRSNWVPNVGLLFEFPNGDSDEDEDEQPLEDMWTFNCPSCGIVFASVDTKDDTDQGHVGHRSGPARGRWSGERPYFRG